MDRVRVGMGPVITTRDITGDRTATATMAVPTGVAGTGRMAAITGGSSNAGRAPRPRGRNRRERSGGADGGEPTPDRREPQWRGLAGR